MATAAGAAARERRHRRVLPVQPGEGGHGCRATRLVAVRRVGLKAGDKLASLVGSEYDQVTPSVPTPRPIEVLFHSPVTCPGHRQFADAAYYTTASGAGVFATGASSWVCGLAVRVHLPPPVPTSNRRRDGGDHDPAREFAAGPAGNAHPARDNLGGSTSRPRPSENDR